MLRSFFQAFSLEQWREKRMQDVSMPFRDTFHHVVTYASVLIQEQQASLESHGIKQRDRARFECVNSPLMLTNTVPTAFCVFSDPPILQRVRKEAGC